MEVETERVQAAISRAEAQFGTALREWLGEEARKGEFDFPDIALAMHSVVSRVAASMAAGLCPRNRSEEMLAWYAEIVLTCWEHHFSAAFEVRNGSKVN